MRRAVLFAALIFLLLAQHRGYVHPIGHLAGRAVPVQETVLLSPALDAPCAECALLAGGFTAVHTTQPPATAGATVDSVLFHSYHSRAGEAPAWFRGRAPPLLA